MIYQQTREHSLLDQRNQRNDIYYRQSCAKLRPVETVIGRFHAK